MTLASLNKVVLDSIDFVERADYVSFDPFDALTNPLLNKVTSNSILLRRSSIQLNAKFHFNVRFLGMKKMVHTKTISDMLSVYSLLYQRTGNPESLKKAKIMLEKLMAVRIETSKGIGWGLNFPYTTRFTNAKVDTPNLYNIVNSTNALLDYWTVSHKDEILKEVSPILNFIETELGAIEIDKDNLCYQYYPHLNIHAYNVNALLAALFVRINCSLKKEIVPQSKITRLLRFIKTHQNNDGSWYYTDESKGKWVDGFHTGFILESLASIQHTTQQYDLLDSLTKGFEYYKRFMFSSESVPMYYPGKLYPIESQNCAQAIQTIANCARYLKLDEKEFLSHIIEKVLKYLYDEAGFFFYKKGKYLLNRNIYFRWSQTPMILALLYSINYLENK
jgi:hypothetical protein